MTRYNIEQIENMAAQLLEEYNMDNEIPIDPILLANKLGIRVYAGDFRDSDISGVIRKNGDEIEILVQADHHPNRQRFTIAHELGHFKLHIDKEELEKQDHIEYRRNKNFSIEEEEANRFAAALLMPRKALLREIESCGPLMKKYPDFLIDYLAIKFFVSKDAMRFRLFNLGLIR
ncbi:MAG TPA: ImmA/IrrE family metallo-endopeptidase [Tissierellaceae bacterium]